MAVGSEMEVSLSMGPSPQSAQPKFLTLHFRLLYRTLDSLHDETS